MQIQQIVLGQFVTNCYVIWGSKQGNCIIIDPADNGNKIVEILEQLKLKPEAILLTHGHYDHFLAVPKLQQYWQELPVYCHPKDCPKELVEYDMNQSFPTVRALLNRRELKDNQQLSLAGIETTVLHTPGHTQGSVTFKIEDALFTGDTLFYRSMGRTDFDGGDEAKMMISLKRLGLLKGNYRVFPGHDQATTLDDERHYNSYLKAALKKQSN
ncbi:MAG: MBL fold metallo-hydrolase [Lachnospiraceae bacterium]